MNDDVAEEAGLAAYQEALIEALLLDMPPAEQLQHLADDPRAQPFVAYVQSMDLRCWEVTAQLMQRWVQRRG